MSLLSCWLLLALNDLSSHRGCGGLAWVLLEGGEMDGGISVGLARAHTRTTGVAV